MKWPLARNRRRKASEKAASQDGSETGGPKAEHETAGHEVSTEKPPVPATKVDSAAAEPTSQQTFQATLTLSSTVAKLKDDKPTQNVQPVRYDEDRLKKLVEEALEENKITVDQVRIES